MKKSNNLANGMGSNEQKIIIEGFICPECQQDLTSVELLHEHFSLCHSASQSKKGHSRNKPSSTESGLSSVIARAKTYIATSLDDEANELNNDNEASSNPIAFSSSSSSFEPYSSHITNSRLAEIFADNQQLGVCSTDDLTGYFKETRDHLVGRYVIQTNKMLNIMDKLVSIDASSLNDKTKRDKHFKSIVSWMPQENVDLCPSCAKAFNLIKRKHHCRLCGAIMCQSCSKFISFSLAKIISDPELTKKLASTDMSFEKALRLSTNLNDIDLKSFPQFTEMYAGHELKDFKSISDAEKNFLRLCHDCIKLVERKYALVRENFLKNDFVSLYEEFHKHLSEANRLYPLYLKASASLKLHGAHSSHNDELSVENLRIRLANLYQLVEKTSADILKYDDRENTQTKRNDQLKLQRNIRFFAVNFLRNHVLS